MFTIKIEFKGKCVALNSKIKTIQKIEDDLKGRYPNQLANDMKLFYGSQQIKEFVDIEQIIKQEKLKCIKLKVQANNKQEEIQEKELSCQSVEKESIVLIKKEKIDMDMSLGSSSSQQFPEGQLFSNQEDQKKNQEKVQDTNEEKTPDKYCFSQSHILPSFLGKQDTSCISDSQISLDDSFQIQTKKEDTNRQSGDLQQIIKISFGKKNISNNLYEPVNHDFEQEDEIKEQASRIGYSKIKNKYAEDIEQGIILNSIVSKEEETPQVKSMIKQNHIKDINQRIDVYLCFYCEGNQPCKVCNGQGRFKEGSKFINLIDQIVEKRLQKKIQSLEKIVIDKIEKNIMQKINKKGIKIQEQQKQYESQLILTDPLAYISAQNQKCEKSFGKVDTNNFTDCSNVLNDEASQIRKDGQWFTIKRQSENYHANKRDLVLRPVNKVAQIQDDILEQQNNNEVQQFDLSSLLDLKIKDHPANEKDIQLGRDFTWIFLITTSSLPPQYFLFNIIDEITGETMPIDLKNSPIIEVGPYNIKSQGKFKKSFKLFYFDDNSDMQYFGPTFGFQVNIIKPLEGKIKEKSFKLKIESLKTEYKAQKSTPQIIITLRQMGIDEWNFEESQMTIIQIIKVL